MKGSILVAEDDPAFLQLLTEALTGEGYFVVAATDGAEAVSLLHLVKYNLIILDLDITKVAGGEMVSMIRSLAMKTPIVLMSGRRDSLHVALKMDIEAYLGKPFELPVLFSVVEDCVNQSHQMHSGVTASL
jgi:two-component system KDP operon response regulator KdpE